ncbi:MAG: hypothetical protein JNN15_09260, partial [Blastocatellia bacterium]|nr:hypothetical protein [Blastocatellia bacterium]
TFNPASASIGVKIDYTKDITAASLVDAKGNVVYTFDDLEETFFRITLTNQCEQCPSTEGTDFTYFYEVAQVPEDDTKILPTVISSVESGTGFCAPTVFGKSTTF